MPETEKKKRTVRLPNFIEALIPIAVMMGLMIYGLNFSGGLYVDAHMPLVVSIVVACIIGAICGHDFSDMLAGMIDRLNATMELSSFCVPWVCWLPPLLCRAPFPPSSTTGWIF